MIENKDIIRLKWIFSKRYKSSPHEYTVYDYNKGEENNFRELSKEIDKKGTTEFFFGKPFKYLYIGDYKYWIMSNPETCSIINRTFSDKTRLKIVFDYINSSKYSHSHGETLLDIEGRL